MNENPQAEINTVLAAGALETQTEHGHKGFGSVSDLCGPCVGATLKQSIVNHFNDNYSSSPVSLNRREINLLIKADCKCEYCGTSIFELDDFPRTDGKEVICEECFHEQYEATCPICEEYFEKALKAKDEKIVVTKEAMAELGIDKPGFYQVTSYPYYRACVVMGVEQLYQSSLKLIRECDINSMHKKLYPHSDEITSGECCHDCVDRYSGKSKIKNNYCDKEYGKKRVAFERKVINDGF